MNRTVNRLLPITIFASLFGGSLKCMESLPLDITRYITDFIMETTLGYNFLPFKQIEVGSTVFSLAFSPNGETVITGLNDAIVRLWDVETGKQLHILQGHTGGIYSVAYSPDGKTVITGSEDKTARLWDRETGQQLHILLGHTSGIASVAYSPDGKTVITGSED